MPEIQPWEEQLAWGDEFDEKEAPGKKASERIVREEEQQEVFEWGDAEQVLAPFHLYKPQVEPSSGGQYSNGNSDSNHDNSVDREAMPFVTTRKKRRKSDTSAMLRGLRAETNSSYSESQRGKLPTMKGIRATHSKRSSSGRSNTGTSEAMVSAVYIVEAGPITYKSARKSDEGANGRRVSTLSMHLGRRIRCSCSVIRYQKRRKQSLGNSFHSASSIWLGKY